LSVAIVALSTVSGAAASAAEFEWLPGAARSIPRTTSASRDAAVLEYAYGPRAQASIGSEFGLVALRGKALSAWLGMYGMIALENADSREFFPPSQLWRGRIGLSGAVSAETLARRWFGAKGALEIGLVVGHESDHGELDDPHRADDIPHGAGGDFVLPDLAFRVPVGGSAELSVRYADRIFVRGDLAHAPAADLGLRIRYWPHLQPMLALFAEELFPSEPFVRHGFRARALVGPAIPGRVGEVLPFVGGELGAGMGLLTNRREARLSLGVRYAPF
jgi:hypothetical protein